jgi:hypothetical protein
MELPEQARQHAQRLLEALNSSEEGNVDRLLIRQIHKYYYSCQCWYDGDEEQAANYISLDAPSNGGGKPAQRSAKSGGDQG